MLKARKKNRVLRIPDEKEEEYKKLGYTITDEEGKIIYEPQDDKQKIAALKKENAELKKQIETLSTSAKTTKPQTSKTKTKSE